LFDILLELVKLYFGGLNVQRCFVHIFELSEIDKVELVKNK